MKHLLVPNKDTLSPQARTSDLVRRSPEHPQHCRSTFSPFQTEPAVVFGTTGLEWIVSWLVDYPNKSGAETDAQQLHR
ncbi:hypothetical protein NDU88_008489 [Pleurodeles waltl]|uniref:Uncharacterized protein n=1 Tax=Pleurodeles waltl TaxID=8319 RepID=A0AAV7PPF8_PLEWA|nr:hypothetical protein NDU88_008489 [Pleurodeles waltl]